jgi:PilZ domain
MRSREMQTARTAPGDSCGVDAGPTVRREIRFPLRAHAAFAWVGRDGLHHDASGYSRDISEHGAYILAKMCPPVRAMIRLVIRFRYRQDPALSRWIEMDARVVRVELQLTNKSGWGFAVASTHSASREIDASNGESNGN